MKYLFYLGLYLLCLAALLVFNYSAHRGDPENED
jgi:hypothetical protein